MKYLGILFPPSKACDVSRQFYARFYAVFLPWHENNIPYANTNARDTNDRNKPGKEARIF